MFSRLKDTQGFPIDPPSEGIRRKTFDQMTMEQLCEAVDELREEVRGLKDVLRTIHSKFETWHDLKRLLKNVEQREARVLKMEKTKENESGDSKVE